MTELAVQQETALSIRPGQTEFNEAQVATLAQLGVVNADRANLAVFFHQAARTGLDPFAKQIYMIARQSSEWDPERREKIRSTKYTIQTGIDGYRLIARRAASRAKVTLSFEDTLWCGPDGVWVDAWVFDFPPTAAKVTLWRGQERFTHVSLWREYVQTYYDKKIGEFVPNSMWSKMPANQLAKTAEAGALRKAFPQDLSGVYVEDEMPASDHSQDDVVEEAIPATMQRVQTGARPPARDVPESNVAEPEPEPAAEPEPVQDVVEEPPLDDTEAAKAAFESGLAATEIQEPPADVEGQGPASLTRRKKLTDLMRPRFSSQQEAVDWLGQRLGRPIKSTEDLNVVECEQLITELT